MLKGVGVTKKFGGLIALDKVDFFVDEKEIVGLIGPNGAGKTTLFNVINGVYRPSEGKIYFKNIDLTGLPPHRICRLGIARTYQIVRPFLNMSVLENVLVGAMFGQASKSSLEDAKKEALKCLEFVNLLNKKDLLARDLNLVERKRLEIARALATKPKVLLLDEVFSGLTPGEQKEAIDLVNMIRNELEITIFWIEHIMRLIMSAVDRVIVLHFGRKIAEGKPKEVSRNKDVIEAYLGTGYKDSEEVPDHARG